MKSVAGLWSIAALALAASTVSAAEASRASKAANAGRHVILITVDGFPARFWRDEALPLPNLRRLAREGAAADAMTVSNPSITWINHTTLVTGVTPRRHGVLFNGLLVRGGPEQPPQIEPWVDKARLVFVPTLYDLAYGAGLTTAEVDWVAVTRPGTIHWSFPEIPSADGKVEREVTAAGLLRPEQFGWFHGPNRKTMVWEDETWTQAACFIFAKHRPNLLLFHLLNTDSTQHQYGPGSAAAYTALALADRQVGDLLNAVRCSGLAAQTTIIVSSDHGFKKVAKIVYPNVLLKQAGLLTAAGAKVARGDVVAVAEGGLAFVYIANPARKAELLPMLQKRFAAAEGVARVLDGHEGPKLGMPTPEENRGMGDLILLAKDGYAFKGEAAGEATVAISQGYLGTHGYPASDPELDGIFIAEGYRIKSGVSLPRVANLDVAPTIAEILGLELPRAEGRVLTEILEAK
jgi:predicted AlkP superfamily pyrophosphatase or phosphodiesterase